VQMCLRRGCRELANVVCKMHQLRGHVSGWDMHVSSRILRLGLEEDYRLVDVERLFLVYATPD
jgi:hypothetical protein